MCLEFATSISELCMEVLLGSYSEMISYGETNCTDLDKLFQLCCSLEFSLNFYLVF